MNGGYFTDEDIVCQECDRIGQKTFLYVQFWQKRNYIEKLICHHCFDSLKKDWGVVVEHKLIMKVEDIPEDAIPIFIRPPELASGRNNETVFTVADKQLADETTDDRTRLAGRETWHGVQIGADVKNIIENKDKPLLKEKDVVKLLEDLKNANHAVTIRKSKN